MAGTPGATTEPPAESNAASGASMPRIATASFIGTAIEFYDFYIYGTAAALVFDKVFFPELSTVAGTLASLSTFAVAFLARPVGSALFGHFGDRIGRKSMLVTSLLMMGLSTVVIGLLPGYATLGILAPILLVLLRVCQGIGLGGEWGGAALLATEHAPKGKRGLYGMFPQIGPAIGYLVASALFLLLRETLDDVAFGSWGWRVPFVASALLVVVGLYVRLKIAETPAFAKVMAERDRSRVPFVDLIRHESIPMLLGAGGMIVSYVLFYTSTTYALSYGTKELELSETLLLLGTMIGVLFMAGGTALTATLSDRHGRRRVVATSAACAAVWGLLLMPMLDTRNPVLVVVALVGGLGMMGAVFGPMGALLPELFSTRTRYSGAAFAYSLGGVLGGAAAPLLETKLQASFGSFAVGGYIAVLALVSMVCVLAMPETRGRSLVE